MLFSSYRLHKGKSRCSIFLLGIFFLVLLSSQAAEAKKRKGAYFWEDASDGFFSLNATSVVVDPKSQNILYAGVNGILYRSKNNGASWTPLARFSGSARSKAQAVAVKGEGLEAIKERLLEEKLQELAEEIGDELAEEQKDSLEREAEDEAEEILRQRVRVSRTNSSKKSRFRRRINRILLTPSDPKIILVATDGGAFLSKNGGRFFKRIFRGFGGVTSDVRCALLDPKNPKKIWLGTRKGLFFTKDSGNLWKRMSGRLRGVSIKELRYDPSSTKIVYAATSRSLFVSKNNGKRFLERFTLSSGRILSLAVLWTKPTRVIVGTESGLYKGKGNGSFQPLKSRGLGRREALYLSSSASHPRWIYLVNSQGVFISRNGGKRFRQMRAGLLSQNVRFLVPSPHQKQEVWIASDYGVSRWSRRISGKVTRIQLKRFRRELRLEPSSWRVAQATLKYFNLRMSLSGMQGRALWHALLPELQLKGTLLFNQDQNFILLSRQSKTRSAIGEGRFFIFEARALWSLERLMFGAAQTDSLRTSQTLQKLREKMMSRVLRLFYARRRVQFRLFTSPPKNFSKYLRLVLKLQEFTAQIDGLSGGYLSRQRQFVKKLRGG